MDDNWTMDWTGPDGGGLVAWGNDPVAAARNFDRLLADGAEGLRLVVRRSWGSADGLVLATGPDGERFSGLVGDGIGRLIDEVAGHWR